MVYIGTREYKYSRMIMSHRIAEDIGELFEMPRKLGVKQKYFQNKKGKPHFDICKKNKQLALELGEKLVNDREIILKFKYMKNVQIFIADDWEGIYINGLLIDEGHHLLWGSKGFLYMLKLAEEHKFTSENVEVVYLTNEQNEWLGDRGNFPKLINEIPE